MSESQTELNVLDDSLVKDPLFGDDLPVPKMRRLTAKKPVMNKATAKPAEQTNPIVVSLSVENLSKITKGWLLIES